MAITGDPPVCGTCNGMYLDCQCKTYREGSDASGLMLQLRVAIGDVRAAMGAPDCETCKRRFRVFMDAMKVAVRASGGDIFMRAQATKIIVEEQKKGHAKASGG